MTSQKMVILLCYSLSLLFISTGNVFSDQCPEAKNGNQDGIIEDSPYKFTFESWIKERKDEHGQIEGYNFGRCIENRGKGTLWNHWKGIMSSGWTPKNERKMHVVGKTSNASTNKDKIIWFGDTKDKKETAETKCWDGEEACKSTTSAIETNRVVKTSYQMVQNWALSEAELINNIMNIKESVELFTYGEVFIPLSDRGRDNNYMRIDILISSVMTKKDIEYLLRIKVRKEDQNSVFQLSKSEQRPLFAINFSEHFLGSYFGKEISFTPLQLTKAILEPSPPIVKKTLGRQTKNKISINSGLLLIDNKMERIYFPISLFNLN